MTHRRAARSALAAGALLAGLVAGPATASAASPAASPPSHYDHVFVVMMENHGYADVIGNPAAPNLNALAHTYGVATDYFGVSHPSEPNYVALLGGSTLGVASDNPYFVNTVDAPSLVSQMDRAGVSWKEYLQSSPHAGYQGICYPGFCNGVPDKDPLYVAKHNPVPNFTSSRTAADWARQVPETQLPTDLASGRLPQFGLIIPDECHDQHGDPPYCLDSGNVDGGTLSAADPQDQHLVATGDAWLGQEVHTITSAPFWAQGNNAVVVTYDEGDDSAGPGGSKHGGGQVATVVVTSHGPRGVQDATPANHYSLLATIQRNFGLGCLQHSCTARTLDHLLTPTGAAARATIPIEPPDYPTPTPTPAPGAEPVTTVNTSGAHHGGWTVQPTPQLGTGDNSLGALSAAAPDDVWAVGNYVPDAKGTNGDATLSLASHYDGTAWTDTATPNAGPNFSTLFGVAALPHQAWAVGTALSAQYLSTALVEHWDGTAWRLADAPTPAGAARTLLFGAAATSGSDVWAVGTVQGADGVFRTLAEHYDGTSWSVVRTPDPGSSGDSFYAVAAAGPDDVWAVGQRSAPGADGPLVEHFDGTRWRVVGGDDRATGVSGLLDAVTVQGGQVWAAGQTDSLAETARPLVARLGGDRPTYEVVRNSGAPFSNLNGITADGHGGVWATGTRFDPSGTYDGQPGGVQQTLVLERTSQGWVDVGAPSPGTADRVLGQVVDTGTELLTGGYDKTPAGRAPLVEAHPVS